MSKDRTYGAAKDDYHDVRERALTGLLVTATFEHGGERYTYSTTLHLPTRWNVGDSFSQNGTNITKEMKHERV